jgi:hypothetical protein
MSYFRASDGDYANLNDVKTSIFPLSMPSSIYRESEAGGYPSAPCLTTPYPQKVKSKIFKKTDNDVWFNVGIVIPENQSLNVNPDNDTLSLHAKVLNDGEYEFRMVRFLKNKVVAIYPLPKGMNFLKNKLIFGPYEGLEDLGILQVWLTPMYDY